MLKILFDQYKWYVAAIIFLVYSVGVWNISTKVAENDFNKERLRHTEEIIRIKQDNENLSVQLKQSLDAQLTAQAEASAKNQKELLDAIKDSRYTSCTNTDRVRELYKRKLQAQ